MKSIMRQEQFHPVQPVPNAAEVRSVAAGLGIKSLLFRLTRTPSPECRQLNFLAESNSPSVETASHRRGPRNLDADIQYSPKHYRDTPKGRCARERSFELHLSGVDVST